MTAKFDKFMDALEALCIDHGVQISVDGYDRITVSDLNLSVPLLSTAIYYGREMVLDHTKEGAP